MARKVHVFDNQVRVYDDHLIPVQRERYRKQNVHEAEEEAIFVELILGLPPDGCYLNIGCAIGYYPLLARRLAPGLRIESVEPLARHREFFAENARLNGYDAAEFAIHPLAVSAATGTARLQDDDYGSALVRDEALPQPSAKGFFRGLAGALGFRAAPVAAPASCEVETTTLDLLVEQIGRTVHLVQMDVQGFELDVLRGAQTSLETGHVETFLIGTHGAALHESCAAELERHGYAIEFSLAAPQEQPDGILVASRGVRRLRSRE